MSFQSILSYYPTYSLLDEIISYGNGKYKQMNVYMDLKNNLQSLYMKHAIDMILENTNKSKFVDTSIFSSILYFLSFNKMYAIRRGLKINFYIFFESGQSYYHLNIHKKYKISRRVDDLYGLDKESRDKFRDVVNQNLNLVEVACSKLPDVRVVRLHHLEADFVPYYLMRNNLVDLDDEVVHITYSNDHDLMQNVAVVDNSYQFSKAGKTKKIIKKGQIMSNYLKTDCSFPDEWYTFTMAILGDPGDDVYGIKGIGSTRISEVLEELVSMVGGIDNLYENVLNNKSIFKPEDVQNQNKYIKTIVEHELNHKTISNNLKLVSFEMLSRILDDPPSTEFIERKKKLIESLNQPMTAQMESMKTALTRNRVFVEDDVMETIFYKPQQPLY